MKTTDRSKLALTLAPGLSVSFEGLSPLIRDRLDRACPGLLDTSRDTSVKPMPVGADLPGLDIIESSELVECEAPILVRKSGATLLLDVPGVVSWADAVRGAGGISVDTAQQADLDSWTDHVVTPLFLEMASAYGWIPLRGIAMQKDDRCVCLPGSAASSGTLAKASIEGHGWETLSESLVWLRRQSETWTATPVPFGQNSHHPITEELELDAIVFDDRNDRRSHRLERVDTPESLVRLVRCVALLTLGSGRGHRFEHLMSLASTVPGFVLRMGPSGIDNPDLLATLLR